MSIRAADPKLGARVGGIVLALLLAGIAYVVFLKDRLFLGPSVTVRVYFTQVGALQEGAPVIVAGTQVGVVTAISLLPADARRGDDPLPPDQNGAVAIVHVDEARRDMVPVNGDYFVASKGIFSDRYLEVGPPSNGDPPGRAVEEGDRVRGIDPPSMDRVLQNTWSDLETARAFLDTVKPDLDQLLSALDQLGVTMAVIEASPGDLDRLRTNLDAAIAEAQTTWLELTAGGARPEDLAPLTARARALLDAGGVAIADLRAHVAKLQAAFDTLRGRLDAARPGLEHDLKVGLAAVDHALDQLDHVRAGATELIAMIQRGEGTIGRIMQDPEFPEDAKELGKILKRQPWRIVGHPQDTKP